MKKIKSNLSNLISKGIPFLFLRDRGHPSVSLTLLVVSFTLWALAATEVIKDMNLDKLENMVMITSGLYFSRKFTKHSNNITEDNIKGEDENVSAK